MGVLRRSGMTASYIFFGRLSTVVFNLVIVVLITRYLGRMAFGQYAFVESYALVLSTLAAGGSTNILIREAAKNRARAGHALGTAVELHAVFAVIAIGVGALILRFLTTDPEVTRWVWISYFGTVVQVYCNLFAFIYVAFEDTRYWALTTALERCIYLLLVLWVILSGHSLAAIFWMKSISFGLVLLINVLIVQKRFVRVAWGSSLRESLFFVRESLPLAASDTLLTLDRQMDVLLLQLWSTPAQVGTFSAPYKIIDRLIILPNSVMSGFLPALSQLQATDRARLRELYRRIFKFFLLLSVPIAVIVSSLAGPIVLLLFTQEYSSSVPILRIVAWIVPCMFLAYLFKDILTVIGRQRFDSVSRTFSVGLHLLLGWLLISNLGAMGAAVATLCAQVFLLLLGYIWISRQLGAYRPYRLLGKLAFVSLLVLGVSRAMSGVSLAISLPLAVGIYVVGYLALRVMDPDEMQAIRTLLPIPGRKQAYVASAMPAGTTDMGPPGE